MLQKEEPKPVVEQCDGCKNVTTESLCRIYLYPHRQWNRLGGCAMRTHNKTKVAEVNVFLDPLKASKRKVKGK